ncbi:unnamed protein product [Fusarium venenatum]|uniref:Uncharacterized protein n=1 Tax=Fusarium venenatum TaxID=56646 RepID=A0A2L2SQB9_9HYPO|nr:uncharacterized protein FVRRES_11801 [Fusarium venenatum]CEI39110.1 unnamed protein product [Fusarium venenatum]
MTNTTPTICAHRILRVPRSFVNASWSAKASTYNYYTLHVEQTGYAETKAKTKRDVHDWRSLLSDIDASGLQQIEANRHVTSIPLAVLGRYQLCNAAPGHSPNPAPNKNKTNTCCA